MKATEAVEELTHLAQEAWVPQNGARVVAKAWSDPAFRQRLLANGRAAVEELGLTMPKHHRHLVVLENTSKCRTSSAARSARARPSRSSACRPIGTRISNIARASCGNRARC
jgi:hypothetical protein